MKQSTKEVCYEIAWAINVVGTILVVMHSWDSHTRKQPHLIAAQIALVVSCLLCLPYIWEKRLARYKIGLNATLYIISACILLLAYLH